MLYVNYTSIKKNKVGWLKQPHQKSHEMENGILKGRDCQTEWESKPQVYAASKKLTFNIDTYRLEIKVWEKIYHVKTREK